MVELLTKHILVFGGTAGLGRQVVLELLECHPNICIVIVVRSMELGLALYGHIHRIRLIQGDVTEHKFIKHAIQGIDYIIICSGSAHLFKFAELMGWQNPAPKTHPKFVDFEGIRNICIAAKEDGCVKHIVMISCAYVQRPFRPISMFTNVIACNTLAWKLGGEAALRQSGIPYTIVRPAQFVEHGEEKNVILDQGDNLSESASITRKNCAKVLVRILDNLKDSRNKTFEVSDVNRGGKKADQVTFDLLKADPESHLKDVQSLTKQHILASRVFFVLLSIAGALVFLVLFYTTSSS